MRTINPHFPKIHTDTIMHSEHLFSRLSQTEQNRKQKITIFFGAKIQISQKRTAIESGTKELGQFNNSKSKRIQYWLPLFPFSIDSSFEK